MLNIFDYFFFYIISMFSAMAYSCIAMLW